jgi:hypothetical protein
MAVTRVGKRKPTLFEVSSIINEDFMYELTSGYKILDTIKLNPCVYKLFMSKLEDL